MSIKEIITIAANLSGIFAFLLAIFIAVYGFFRPTELGGIIGEILDRQERDSQNLETIADNTENSAREISDDPVVQLVKRGYNFTINDFFRSINQSDYESAGLFCDAAPEKWIDITYRHSEPGTERFDFLVDCNRRTNFLYCKEPNYSRTEGDYKYIIKFLSDSEFVKVICGADYIPNMRRKLEHLKENDWLEEDIQTCKDMVGKLDKIVSSADTESWQSVANVERRYMIQISGFKGTPIGEGSAYELCPKLIGVDLLKAKRELRQRWERGGKSKP